MNEEIKNWLRERDYTFDIWRDKGGVHISNYDADDWYGWEDTEVNGLKRCLNHWLTGQLGIHWRKIWEADKLGLFLEGIFDGDLAELQQAVNYIAILEAQP